MPIVTPNRPTTTASVAGSPGRECPQNVANSSSAIVGTSPLTRWSPADVPGCGWTKLSSITWAAITTSPIWARSTSGRAALRRVTRRRPGLRGCGIADVVTDASRLAPVPVRRGAGRARAWRLFVLQCLEDVQPRRAPRGKHGREQADGGDPEDEDGHRAPRDREHDALIRQRLCSEHREEDADSDSERSADQRRDDAFEANHPPHLTPRHPDGPEHPELTCPLEHRQHERVHDAEDADQHREPEQAVENVEDDV